MRLHPAGALAHWGKHYPSKEALTIQDETYTYGAIDKASDALSFALRSADISKGDSVAIVCPSSINYVNSLFACLKIGAIAIPLDFGLRPDQLERIIVSAKCRAVFIDQSYSEFSDLRSLMQTHISNEYIITLGDEVGRGNPLAQALHRKTLVDMYSAIELDFSDVLTVLFSSGTTGVPKGVVKTCYQITSELFVWITELGFGFEKTLLLSTPLYYTGGFLLLLATTLIGGHLVSIDQFTAGAWLEALSTYQVTHGFLNPSQSKHLLSHESPGPKVEGSSLELIVTMSDVTRGDMKLQLARRFQCGVIDVWGNTEGVGTIMKKRDLLSKPDSIGKPFLTDEVRVVDEELRELEPGAIGELVGKTDSSFVGYFEQPGLTAETLRDGWILSGDLGWRDEDGYYYFAGRKKTIIKVNGASVYPRDIEEVLEQHPGVHEAAVFGVEFPDLGERPVAAVILSSLVTIELKTLHVWANSMLSSTQQLADLVVYDDFPRTSARKVIRQRLAEDYVHAAHRLGDTISY